MKKTRTCPKCKGHSLLYIRHVAEFLSPNIDSVVGIKDVDDKPALAGYILPWRIARVPRRAGFLSSHHTACGLVEAFICKACGLTEFYTRDPAAIPPDGATVIAIDSPVADAPYR